MNMPWPEFSEHLSQQLKQELHIHSANSVSGGDIHQAYRLTTNLGDFFLKLDQANSLPLFATEAHSLQAIHDSDSIACPKAIASGIFNQQAWLLMEHLSLTSRGDDKQRGRDLANMHQTINQAPQPFGWFEDNFIGHTLQKNQWHFTWVDFYGQQRLLPQIELSQLNGASRQVYDLGVELIDELPYWFRSYEPQASLLHGDLWGGNSAFIQTIDQQSSDQHNPAVIFDPASYYGDRETDIAMTELFGGYSHDFYLGYNEVYPLDKDYASRKTLYNLYHILNHFNLFGGHYQQQAINSMQKLLAEVQ